MLKFRQLFKKPKCSIIGMVHVDALPGTPLNSKQIDEIVYKACSETEIYLRHNIDSILIENMHDIPYIQAKYFGPETTAFMTRICTEVKKIVPKDFPCGVQVLAGGNREALAIAKACSFDYIRAEGFVFGHIGDEGYMDANAGQILRYRKKINADNILVFADVKKKHSSHSITSDVSLEETARAAEFFLADGIILTGSATGNSANTDELNILKTTTTLPVLIGSGVTTANVHKYISAQALIIGSHFKKAGKWSNSIDEKKVADFFHKFIELQ